MKPRSAKPSTVARVGTTAELRARLHEVESRLRELEERHELAMGAIRESVYDWDIEHGGFSVSKSMNAMLGLPGQSLTLQAWQERIHPEDFGRFRDETIAHLKGNTERFECDYRYRAGDGAWRWARTHGLALRNAEGRAVRMVGSTGDITELKQRERELAEQRAILETTFENIDQGITMVDKNLRTIALNRKFLELLEFPPERFARGFRMEEAFRFNAERGEYGPGDVEEQVRQRVELSRRFEPHTFERTRPNGQVIAVRGKPLPGGGFVSTYTDITEQKRTERALRESEERYALATRAATEGIYEWNVESGALFLSDRAREVFGLPPGELRNSSWNERVHPDDMPAYRAALVEHFKGRTGQLECEYRVRDAFGSYRWILDRAKAVRNPEGRVVKLIGAESDITQRKLAEIELRRARDQAEEALEQQTATAEVLRVTSSSPTDAQPVFEAILTNALRLCEASFAAVFTYDGECLQNVAHRNASPAFAQALRNSRPRPSRETTTRLCALERRTVHTADLLNDPAFSPPEAQRRENVRTSLSVPMIREDVLVGVITLWRSEVKRFSGKQIALVETFAAQAVIAIENVRLFNETREALEQQKAIAEVLGVVTQLQTDVQPVFEAIGRNAARLCGALFSCVYRFDGELIHLVATHNLPPAAMKVGRTLYPMRPDRSQLSGRAVLTRSVQRLEDAAQDADYAMHVAVAGGWRRLLAVPMLSEAEPLGVIAVGWRDPGPIPEPRVELLKTFADQAVIAIEKVRLFNETKEALEQQKALAEVLGTMSRSVANTKPVFDLILDSCQRLFEGHLVGLTLAGEDGLVRLGAYRGENKEEMARVYPYPLDRDSGSGQAMLERKVVHFPDVDAPGSQAPPRVLDGSRAAGFKSIVFAPLVAERRALGALWVGRRLPGPFSEREIALLKSFADQAVIAIQNARLFNETKEALEQQTAISEVLQVISSSPTDVRPVLSAVAERAARLCDAEYVTVFMAEDGVLRAAGYSSAAASHPFPEGKDVLPFDRSYIAGRAAVTGQTVHLEDVVPLLESEFTGARENQEKFGFRTFLAVPLLRNQKAIGVIAASRRVVRRFSDKQVALLETFADQAVIAIENVRLFRETAEALEQQKASGEVLQAISGSIADTAPVFDKILESCQRLFAGTIVGLNLVREDGMLHIGAYHGAHRSEFERIFPIPLAPESGSGLSILERRVVHYPDAEHDEVPERTRRGCKAIGIKSAIFAPVLWEGRGLGAIFVGRDHASSFSDKEIALLRTFADQAAIAIENVRLFNETKRALERQTATAEILTVISSSPTDTKPVFDAIVQSGLRLFSDAAVSVALPNGGEVRAAAVAESDPERAAAWRGRFPFPLTREYMHGVAILERRIVDIPDVREAPPEMAAGASNFLASGYRAITIMPMMRGEEAIGALSVVRLAPGPLSDKQLAVLKTFADQAVIAIENVRLFNEIREKSAELEIASRHKSQFLANMSHELRTPLNAIIGFTRIVMRRSQEQLERKQYENLEKILSSGEQLLALINSILDLSKIEAGRVEVHPGEIGLAPVLEQCLRTVEPLARVALVREFEGELPRMYVDEDKLRQIVINLLSNAAKFTEHGTIRVRAQAANGSVAIAVSDTGIGIASDKLDLIFEEFEQADTSSTRVYGGTGLGLAIARRLARLMGGDITAESVPGAGSTFRLILPVRYRTPA